MIAPPTIQMKSFHHYARNRAGLIGKRYRVYRIRDSTPLINLNTNYADIYGVCGTVIGVPEQRLEGLERFNPAKFQMFQFGQRAAPVRR